MLAANYCFLITFFECLPFYRTRSAYNVLGERRGVLVCLLLSMIQVATEDTIVAVFYGIFLIVSLA